MPRPNPVSKLASHQKAGLLTGPLLFIFIMVIPELQGMSSAARAILASTCWIATWWVTEAIPIEVTSLLPIILFPLTGGLDLSRTTAAYGHQVIFLFLGGLIIAVAIERWNLHRRIALKVIKAMGTGSRRVILGFMLATALLSMWISNTASALMMLPIGLAVIGQLGALMKKHGESQANVDMFSKALMLGIAYSASIGGMATLIGTPPNGILAGQIEEIYKIDIGFAQWMSFGLPASLILLFICWLYLVRGAFSMSNREFPGSGDEINRQLTSLGKMSSEERRVMMVFSLTAFCWISRGFLLNRWLPGLDDTSIAIAGAASLFLIPSRSEPGRMLLDWQSAVKLPWGILLLFGAGFSLASGFIDSGLADWIGSRLSLLEGISLVLVLLTIIATVNFLTEVTSNTATTTMILPVLASLALALDVHPFILMSGACVAASCAFMLPVATPPNAVVFGSGLLRIKDMVRAGFLMNVISIIVLTVLIYLLLPWLWGLDPSAFPASLK